MTPYPVMVTWVDSCDVGPAQWLEPEALDDDALSPETIVTVGWLLSRDKQRVVFALSIAASGDLRGVFVIPSPCVVKVERLTCRS